MKPQDVAPTILTSNAQLDTAVKASTMQHPELFHTYINWLQISVFSDPINAKASVKQKENMELPYTFFQNL